MPWIAALLVVVLNINSNAQTLRNDVPSVATGENAGHEYVDLGLPSGTMWATCNVGAAKPNGIGFAYAWGETDFYHPAFTNKSTNLFATGLRVTAAAYSNETNVLAKQLLAASAVSASEPSWKTYKWCNGDNDELTKYNTHKSNGKIVDNITTLESEDDVASAEWGGSWHMPSAEDCAELAYYCSFKYGELALVPGWIVTGPNGNSIFLPAGSYWTNNLNNESSKPDYALAFVTAPCGVDKVTNEIFGVAVVQKADRFKPLWIRPVFSK